MRLPGRGSQSRDSPSPRRCLKVSCCVAEVRVAACAGHTDRKVRRQDEMRIGQKNKLHGSLGQKKVRCRCRSLISAPNRLICSVRARPELGDGSRAGAASLQQRSHVSSIIRRDRDQGQPRSSMQSCALDQAGCMAPQSPGAENITLTPSSSVRAPESLVRKHLGSSMRAQLAFKSDLQILPLISSRSLLLTLGILTSISLENDVHRTPRLGNHGVTQCEDWYESHEIHSDRLPRVLVGDCKAQADIRLISTGVGRK